MTPHWLSFFGFERPPFGKDIADADLWLPSSRKEIVDEIVEGVSEQGHVLLVGEPGLLGPLACALAVVRFHRQLEREVARK